MPTATIKKIKRWNKYHAILVGLSGIGVLFFNSLMPLLLMAFLSFSWYVLSHLQVLKSFKPFGGYANWITLFRLALIFFTGWAFSYWPYSWIFVPVLIIACLDGVDGYLARKYNQQSDFGAYLDMESDTFYVCLLCTAYFLEGLFDWWILLIGFLRYIYVVLLYLFDLQNKPEKSTRFAKTIAVALFIALMFPLLFPKAVFIPGVMLASISVFLSFARSFFLLLRS